MPFFHSICHSKTISLLILGAQTLPSNDNNSLRDQALINFVKYHPELWDKSRMRHKKVRDMLWNKLLSQMQEDFPMSMKSGNGQPIDNITKLKQFWKKICKKTQMFYLFNMQ